MNQWKEYKDYWEHLAPQGTDEWKNARKGRITASKTGSMVGRSTFSTPEETGLIIAGKVVEEFKPLNKLYMEHECKMEPIARSYYERKYNVKVVERGLCIPKYPRDMWLGASVDGDVLGTDGIIEIKCPKSMYGPIKRYCEHKENGIYHDNYNHIWPTHYDQMQQGMKILNKKYCDYIVYCDTDKQVFIQRIPFDENYWYNDLYPKLKENYRKYIYPHLENGYPICPK